MSHSPWILVALTGLIACSGERATPLPLAEASLVRSMSGVSGRSLGTLGGAASYANDVSDAGVVVGWAHDASGAVRPFRWSDAGGMKDLGTLPGDRSGIALRIRADGTILGTSTSEQGTVHVVIWGPTGRIVRVPVTPPRETPFVTPTDFNARGDVVGDAFGNLIHGWFWSRATGTIDLRDSVPSCLENSAAAINDAGVVTGSYCFPAFLTLHAFTWQRGHGFQDLGMVGQDSARGIATATDINAGGVVSGWMDPVGNSTPRPFLWSAGQGFMFLPTNPGPGGFAYTTSLADDGSAVGGSTLGVDGFAGMAWPDAHTMLRLDGPTGQTTLATAVNNRGMAVGWEADGSGNTVAVLWRLGGGSGASRPTAVSGEFRPEALPPAAACVADTAAMRSRARMMRCVLAASAGH